MKPDEKRLTWKQIVKKYPHTNVGLVDIENGVNKATVASAVVKCTDRDTDINEMVLAALRGELRLEYTTHDLDFPMENVL